MVGSNLLHPHLSYATLGTKTIFTLLI